VPRLVHSGRPPGEAFGGRRGVVLTLVAVGAFLVSCAVARGGFFSSVDPGDVGRYHDFANQMRDGRLPYRDFYMEYPPGAIPTFLAPLLLGAIAHYNLAFKFTVAVAGVGLVLACAAALRLLRAEPPRVAATFALVATAPVALGAVVLNRYDLWPALLCQLALVALLADRPRLGFGFLALGCVVKLYPLVVLPIAALHVLRKSGHRALAGAATSFVVVFAVTVLPFAALAPGGLGYSVYTQSIRHLQLESLGSSLLLAADNLGLYSGRIIAGKPGSLDLSGTLPNALGVLTVLVFLAALAAVVVAYYRADESDELLVLGFAASVTAFVAFSKVISPQFLVWLVPLVPLVGRRVGLMASAVLFAALVTTQVEVVYEHPLRAFGWPVWVLLARNMLLIVLFLLLLSAFRAGRQGVPRPTPG
jgi:uncharacterized membrane protein